MRNLRLDSALPPLNHKKLNGNLGHCQVLRVSPAVSVGLPVAAAVRNIMVKVLVRRERCVHEKN